MQRRTFLQKSSLATAGMITAFNIPGFAQNRKLKIGLIGAGWYGMVITKAALKYGGVECVAVCDIDSEHLKKSADELENLQGSRPKEFADYIDLLDVKGLEVVMIGSVPHWHALHFIAACKKGLDVYCEKPLAYDVREGQAMIKAAKKAGNIVQIGFQRRQSNAFMKAKELIEAGKIGKVRQIGAQIHYNPPLADHTIQDPPASLDWETWCGPAPKLDYRPSIGHNKWRLEKEYGNGHLVDWGIHHIDIIRTIMGFGMPTVFDSKGNLDILKGKITTPDTLNARMEFEGCPVVWQHRFWGPGDLNPQYNNGVFFYGEKGTLYAADRKIVVQPAGKDATQQVQDIQTPGMQENHVADFLKAVKAKDKSLLSCKIEDAFQSTTTVQLAMVSYYTNSKVVWDTEKLDIVDNPEAVKLLARPYRGKYKRPKV
ncbi:MAG: Gfo/Idh/MocA family oxidoreductase [Draconibacterium sp.]|nr:Gfo/Idh/MocA family oxidoreductase [Draconibacterium sp.]